MVAQDCARMYRANSVLTASPGQLVLMLYDGALRSMALARQSLAKPATDRGRIMESNTHLLKAQRIIVELQATLKMDAGDGKFSQEMFRLYGYFIRRLIDANLRKIEEPVIEVEKLLGQIRDSWAEMLRKQDPAYSKGDRNAA
jgi:flagellar protein FliS